MLINGTMSVILSIILQINKFKSSIILNKPIAIGVAILDLSKKIMYEYFYEVRDNYYLNYDNFFNELF